MRCQSLGAGIEKIRCLLGERIGKMLLTGCRDWQVVLIIQGREGGGTRKDGDRCRNWEGVVDCLA